MAAAAVAATAAAAAKPIINIICFHVYMKEN